MTRVTRALAFAACVLLLAATLGSAQQVDSKAVEFVAPDQIKWVRNEAAGNETAVLFGDPSKEGPYVVRLRWLPGHMSRPHFHQNDRFFVVISGTWWLGTGDTFNPDSTVPVGPGTYVIHKAKQVHYDGAKGEPTVIQVWGMGPATSIPAEKK